MKIENSLSAVKAFAANHDIHFGFGDTGVEAATDSGLHLSDLLDIMTDLENIDSNVENRAPYHAAGKTMFTNGLRPYIFLASRAGEWNTYAYATALHELGHAMLGHGNGPYFGESERARLRQELDAWSWAEVHSTVVDDDFRSIMHAALDSYIKPLAASYGLDDADPVLFGERS